MQFYVNPSERNGCADIRKEVGVSWGVRRLRCLNASVTKIWKQLVWYCCHLRQVEQGRVGPRWRGLASGAKYYHLLSHGPFPHQPKPKDDYYVSIGHPCICRVSY